MNSNQDGKKPKENKLPGYPSTPPEEDIYAENSGMRRVETDVEGNPRNERSPSGDAVTGDASIQNLPPLNEPVEGSIEAGPNDLTEEDLAALGDENLSNDDGDDELLKSSTGPDLTGEDLDVPGSELDDESEEIGSEDEENNLYSLGGDNHDR